MKAIEKNIITINSLLSERERIFNMTLTRESERLLNANTRQLVTVTGLTEREVISAFRIHN